MRTIVKSLFLYSLRILWVILIGSILWLAGLVLFTNIIPSTSPHTLRVTDGIVIFTGGKTRLNVALDLFQQKYAQYLLVSGVNPDSTFTESVKQIPNSARITLGYSAQDTLGNAEETASWVRAHQIRTLRLITSNYHIPRSLLELRHLLPAVEIIPHPVVGQSFLQRKWWLNPQTLKLVVQEYNKFIFALMRRPLEDIQDLLSFKERKE